MAVDLIRALDARIKELESQLAAVREARKALTGAGSSVGAGPRARKKARKRRKLTAAERAAISRRMKAAWARRKKAAQKG